MSKAQLAAIRGRFEDLQKRLPNAIHTDAMWLDGRAVRILCEQAIRDGLDLCAALEAATPGPGGAG